MPNVIPAPGVPVEVWFDADRRPERLVLQAKRMVVIDDPTPLGYAEPSPALTHPPAGRVASAWRFTARASESGDVRVLDIEQTGDHWILAAAYV